MSDFPFPGLNLALTTPFDADGQIDFAALETNIERYLDAGITSFLLSSGTGMHVYLTREESDSLVSAAGKIINGRAKLIAQTSALMVEDVIDRTKHAADAGASGVMVLPPFFEGPTGDDDIVRFYESVNEGGLPIMGYNVPQAVGVTITPGLLRRLNEIPNFSTVKDSSGDFAGQTDLIRTGLPVMNGDDPLTLYALYAGVAGVVWGGANIAPRHCLNLVQAAEAGEWDRARELWTQIDPLMSTLSKGDYVQSVYAAAEITGYGAGNPRRPLSALSADKRDVLERVLRDNNLLEQA